MGHEGHDHDHHDQHDHHHHDPVDEHRHDAPSSVAAFVITCSDTRSAQTDEGGPLAVRLLEQAGHSIVGTELVKDDAAQIVGALEHALSHGARLVIFTGGTGLARRDVTIETLEPRFEKRIDGFGELFRVLSHAQVGSAAMLSRAAAGVVQGAAVFCLPGSPRAVKLAMEQLILPEAGHLVRELVRP